MKVIQITAAATQNGIFLYALGDDGSIWVRLPVHELPEWVRMDDPPGVSP